MCSANTALGYAFQSSGMGLPNPAVIASKAAEFNRGINIPRPPDFYGGAAPAPTPQAFNQPSSGTQSLLIRASNVRSR